MSGPEGPPPPAVPLLRIEAEAPGSSLRAIPRVLSWSETGDACWIALRLRPCEVLTVVAHDGYGRTVPGAEILADDLPMSFVPTWAQDGDLDLGLIRGRADDRGRCSLTLPPRSYRVWASRPGGVFGKAVEAEVSPSGTSVEIGVPVGGEEVETRIEVVDGAGEAVPGAFVALEFPDGAKRTAGTPCEGTRNLHRADERGRIVLRQEATFEPLLLGIGSPEHRVVSVAVDNTPGPPKDFRVRLDTRPRFWVVLRSPAGELGPCPDWEVDCREAPDAGGPSFRTVLLGYPVHPESPRFDNEFPAVKLADHLSEVRVSKSGDPWRREVVVGREGRYQVAVDVPGSGRLVREVGVPPEGSAPSVEFELGGGRSVRLHLMEGGSAESGRRPLTPTEWSRVVARALSREGQATPAPDEGRGPDHGSWALVQDDGTRGTTAWIPWDRGVLEFLLTDPLEPSAEPLAWRVIAVPDGPAPEVEVRLDLADERARGLEPVEVRVLLGGAPLREAGLDIALSPVGEGLWGPRTRWGVTDPAGRARIWAPPGTYLAACGPGVGPAKPVRAEVPAFPDGATLDLEFPSGMR